MMYQFLKHQNDVEITHSFVLQFFKGLQGPPGMSREILRKLGFLRNLKGFLGAFLMRVWLISVFKLVRPDVWVSTNWLPEMGVILEQLLNIQFSSRP